MERSNHAPLVVGIGASAGGLEALRGLLAAVPADSALSFVVALHLPPDHASQMSKILDRATPLEVVEAVDAVEIEPGRVYVIRPDSVLRVRGHRLDVSPLPDEHSLRLVDELFGSLAREHGEAATGVILSGAGSDGSAGVRAILARGGFAIAQAPETAGYDSMPRHAVTEGGVRMVLPVEDMPEALAQRAAVMGEHPAAPSTSTADGRDLRAILELLGERYGLDFTRYKTGTLTRRLARRMELARVESRGDYLTRLRESPEELGTLYQDLLIGVTRFFRDPRMWQELEATLVPGLLAARSDEAPLRAWVAGCATGEEAYSLAMVLLDAVERSGSSLPVQVFGTDVDAAAVAFARSGRYPASREEELRWSPKGTPDRETRFFKRTAGSLVVGPRLREAVTLGVHNLLADPPFANLDLVSCRNVLIYLDPGAQSELLELLHFALRPGGLLLLGGVESPGLRPELFEAVDAGARIYRRTNGRRGRFLGARASMPIAPIGRGREANEQRDRFLTSVQGAVLRRFSPACVVISRTFEILYFFGPTGDYLQQPSGQARLDFLSWVPTPLYAPLRRALREASESGQRVVLEGLRLPRGDGLVVTECIVEPLFAPGAEGTLVVAFRDGPSVAPTPRSGAEESFALKAELQTTRDELRRAVDELKEIAEEDRAAHEELLALNEELQVGNEELETSNEERKALNEELEAVNEQVRERNAELQSVYDDLDNLFVSTEIPVVFLDEHLDIRRVTPTASSVMYVSGASVGQPLEGTKLRFVDDDLLAVARHVLEHGGAMAAEICTDEGRWFTRVARPYRSRTGPPAGVSLAFHEITTQKRAAARIDEERRYAEAIVETVLTPLVVLDQALCVHTANAAFYEAFDLFPSAAVGVSIYELGEGRLDTPPLRALLEQVGPEEAAEHAAPRTYEIEDPMPGGGTRVLRMNARQMSIEGRSTLVLLAISDITEPVEAARAAKRYAKELANADRQKDTFIAMLGHELRNPLAAIAGGIELLGVEGTTESHAAELRSLLQRQTRRLTTMVNELLDLSRVVSGKIVLKCEAVDLRAVTATALETVASLVSTRGQTLETSVPPPGEIMVMGDPIRLAQVIENVVANATKYTPSGGRIRLEVDAEGAWARVLIRDTGVGIEAHLMPYIFEPFVQESRALDRARGGLGLGLPLVKGLVEMHDGEVKAFSEGPGKGTEVVITLPRLDTREALSAPPALFSTSPAHEAKQAKVSPRRVLVVDDEVDIANLLRDFLEGRGHQVVSVHEGSSALEVVESFRPEVVFLDLGLPDMDGYAVAQHLRERHPEGELVLVALSGYARDADRLDESGFDSHFLKPVDFEELADYLAALPEDAP